LLAHVFRPSTQSIEISNRRSVAQSARLITVYSTFVDLCYSHSMVPGGFDVTS
jgi:hypothetical protein